MSTELDKAMINENIEGDPAKPYKMYGAIASAFLTSLVTSNLLTPWATAIITAFICGITVFLISNPLQAKESVPILDENEDTLF